MWGKQTDRPGRSGKTFRPSSSKSYPSFQKGDTPAAEIWQHHRTPLPSDESAKDGQFIAATEAYKVIPVIVVYRTLYPTVPFVS